MFIPAFLVVEASTVWYNATLFLQKQGKGESQAYKVFTGLFVVTFFLLRVVWMPYATYVVMVHNTDAWHEMGLFKYALVPICSCMLQYYWFSLISVKVYQLVTGKDSGHRPKHKKKGNAPGKTDGASKDTKKQA